MNVNGTRNEPGDGRMRTVGCRRHQYANAAKHQKWWRYRSYRFVPALLAHLI